MLTNRFATRQQLLENINASSHIPTSERTLREERYNMDILDTVPRKLSVLTSSHKKTRLQWAKFHKSCTAEDYERIIWYDKFRFWLYSNDVVQYYSTVTHRVHLRTNEAFYEDCV